MKIILKTDNQEKIDNDLCNYIVLLLFVQAFNVVIKNTTSFADISSYTNLLLKVILFAYLIISARHIIFKNAMFMIVPEIIGILLYSISYVMGYASESKLINYAIWTIGACIPAGVYSFYIKDKSILLKKLYTFSYITSAILLLMFIGASKAQNSIYSMSFGYSLLFPCIILMCKYEETYKFHDLILAIIDLLMIIIYGNRGAMICAVIYILISIIFNMRASLKKALIILTFVLIAYFYRDSIEALYQFATKYGFKGRTLLALINGELVQSKSRNYLINYYLIKIWEKPIFGWGVAGGWTALDGSYPHNIFLEFLMSFGILIGGFLSVIYLLCCLYTLVIRNYKYKKILVLLFCASLEYLFSGTFLQGTIIYVFIGFSVSVFMRISSKKDENNA